VLTRQGVVVLLAGAAAVAIGRIFAVIELFVIGAACFAAAIVAVAYVRLRRPRVRATRWIHPVVLVAGDTGRVDVHLEHTGRIRSAPCVLRETVRRTMGDERIARLPVDAMPRTSRSSTGYQLPTALRGVIVVGPLDIEVDDPLGLARSTTTIADTDEVIVAPRAHLLDMPQLGQGVLGNELLAKARRLGPGEFHGLREYAEGDEPRTIHWKASARSNTLMVKEYAVEGLHRCTVVFDASPAAHRDAAAFERGVTAAASLVYSAVRAGLTTRFVTAGGVDLRGPEVAVHSLRVLARIEPTAAPLPMVERDTGDGLGLVVVVTGSAAGPAWSAARSILDPTLTTLLVSTDDATAPTSEGRRLTVAARTEDEFVTAWQSLAGHGRLDLVEERA
jgi:uncharacterized protein (DUF58 family)